MPTWKNVVSAALHDTSHIEIVNIEKRSDRDAQHVPRSLGLLHHALQEVLDLGQIRPVLLGVAEPVV